MVSKGNQLATPIDSRGSGPLVVASSRVFFPAEQN